MQRLIEGSIQTVETRIELTGWDGRGIYVRPSNNTVWLFVTQISKICVTIASVHLSSIKRKGSYTLSDVCDVHIPRSTRKFFFKFRLWQPRNNRVASLTFDQPTDVTPTVRPMNPVVLVDRGTTSNSHRLHQTKPGLFLGVLNAWSVGNKINRSQRIAIDENSECLSIKIISQLRQKFQFVSWVCNFWLWQTRTCKCNHLPATFLVLI